MKYGTNDQWHVLIKFDDNDGHLMLVWKVLKPSSGGVDRRVSVRLCGLPTLAGFMSIPCLSLLVTWTDVGYFVDIHAINTSPPKTKPTPSISDSRIGRSDRVSFQHYFSLALSLQERIEQASDRVRKIDKSSPVLVHAASPSRRGSVDDGLQEGLGDWTLETATL